MTVYLAHAPAPPSDFLSKHTHFCLAQKKKKKSNEALPDLCSTLSPLCIYSVSLAEQLNLAKNPYLTEKTLNTEDATVFLTMDLRVFLTHQLSVCLLDLPVRSDLVQI